MASSGMGRELPGWAIPAVVVIGILIVVVIAWRAFTGGTGPIGPAKEVTPGMYDFRKEAAAGNIGRRHHEVTNPSTPAPQ